MSSGGLMIALAMPASSAIRNLRALGPALNLLQLVQRFSLLLIFWNRKFREANSGPGTLAATPLPDLRFRRNRARAGVDRIGVRCAITEDQCFARPIGGIRDRGVRR